MKNLVQCLVVLTLLSVLNSTLRHRLHKSMSMKKFRQMKQQILNKQRNIDNNMGEKGFSNNENESEHKRDLKIFLKDEDATNPKEEHKCIVELKENGAKVEEESEAKAETTEDETDVCECNVRCIENCQNIQLGLEDLPVQHLEKNKYMIETYEEKSVTCHQSCYVNLQRLGCEVHIKEKEPYSITQ